MGQQATQQSAPSSLTRHQLMASAGIMQGLSVFLLGLRIEVTIKRVAGVPGRRRAAGWH